MLFTVLNTSDVSSEYLDSLTRYAEEFAYLLISFLLFSQIAYRSVSELGFPDLKPHPPSKVPGVIGRSEDLKRVQESLIVYKQSLCQERSLHGMHSSSSIKTNFYTGYFSEGSDFPLYTKLLPLINSCNQELF